MRSLRRFVPLLLVPAGLVRSAEAQAPLYTLTGDTDQGAFGQSVCALPDVDGDGIEDFAVGAPLEKLGAERVGSVSIYSGDTGAVLVQAWGPHAGSKFGQSLALAPNLDGDGRADLLVGAPGFVPSSSPSGGAFVISTATGAVLRTHMGSLFDEEYGFSVAWIGDSNGDAVNDYAIGAPGSDVGGRTDNGRVVAYSGASGVSFASTSFDQDDAQYGFAVSWAGDYDHDGRPDYVVGAPGYSNGAAVGSGYARVVSGMTHGALQGFLGQQPGERLGHAVAGLADLDGDLKSEVAVASPHFNGQGTKRGIVRVYRGGGNGVLLHSFEGIDNSYTGFSLARANDFDGDGLRDIAAGAPGFYFNSIGTLGAVRIHTAATGELRATVLGPVVDGGFGRSLSGAFDLNNDSCAELVVGSPEESAGGTWNGAARLLLGSVTRPYAYCTGKTSSAGCTPRVSSTGAPSRFLGDNFHVLATDVMAQKSGVLFWGLAQANLPFHGGTLCVAQPVVRTALQGSGGVGGTAGCDGSFDFHFSQAYIVSHGLSAGTFVCAQYWYRDPGFPAPDNIGLSNALRFEIAP